jgi:hypothetical protein
MVRKIGFRFYDLIVRFQVQAFRLPALVVQQHSGDWAMTGKVPVARVEGQRPWPAPNRKDESHPAHQDHGRIAGR